MEGFRVKKTWPRVDRQAASAFGEIAVANVSDCMWRMDAGGSRLRPLHRGGRLAGPALTVRSRPGDNLMLHKALDLAEPGDVIVCDAGGDTTNALFGELMLAHALKRRIGGLVIYGAVRDAEAIAAQDMPVYAVGVTHRGPYKDGPGEVGFPISIEGMVIHPGDLILGDADGVLCVPRAQVGAVAERARAKKAAEDKQMATTHAGLLDRSWVDRSLEQRGCEFVD